MTAAAFIVSVERSSAQIPFRAYSSAVFNLNVMGHLKMYQLWALQSVPV